MTEETGFNWVQAHAGAVGVGVASFVFFIISEGGFAAVAIPSLVLGLILVLLVAGLAWWAYRKGKRELAMGVVAGYAVLSLISGGQCTLLTSSDSVEGFGALTGFLLYPALLVVALLIGVVVTALDRARRRKEDRQ